MGKIENNALRALAGIILLILAIVLMFSKDAPDIINYILLALAGFLVGGQLLGKDNIQKKDE